MYVYICIYIYIYICIYIRIYIYVCIYIYTYLHCMCLRVRVRIYICLSVCVHKYKHDLMSTIMNLHIYTHTDVYTHVYHAQRALLEKVALTLLCTLRNTLTHVYK